MKAAVMRGVDHPLSVAEVEVDAPNHGEVLIDVKASGLCHSDLKFIEGAFLTRLPALLGHEAAGIVAAVGDEVTGLAPGDHVVTTLAVHCGDCALCLRGGTHLCVDKHATRRGRDDRPRISFGGEPLTQGFDLGAFAPQMLVHHSAVIPIDDSIPLDRAALLGCGVATGLGAVLNTARVQEGDSVAVIGCGGVGLSAVQGARIAGADPVIAVDTLHTKLDLARSLGAHHVVDASSEDPVGRVIELADGLGVDHVIEAVGSVATVEQAIGITRRGGTTTVVGLVPSGSEVSVSTDALFYERKLQGSLMGSNDFGRDIPRYVRMYLEGDLRLDDLISDRIDLEQINDGFEAMRAGKATRTVIMFGDSP